jgi:hypothetical protein
MITVDEKARDLAARIKTEEDHDTLMALFSELDRHIFETKCAKPYLDQPDPGPTCSFYRAGTCGYVNAIKAIYDEYGVNIPDRDR